MRDPKPQSSSPKDSPFSRAYVLYAIGLIFFVSVFSICRIIQRFTFVNGF